MQWYVNVIKNYTGFNGRARRKEYWMFTLFNTIIYALLSMIEPLIGVPFVLSGLYGLAVLLPSLAVSFRRLHDTGRTGLWILIGLVPFVGGIILLVFNCQDSQPQANEYGPNPKAV